MNLLKINKIVTKNRINIFNNNKLSTVNNNEINKFSKIGKDWWNSSSNEGAGPLHSMNPCRVKFIVDSLQNNQILTSNSINNPLSGIKILDVGCGGGLLSTALARLGANITAIDPSDNNINIAKYHSQFDPLTNKINYQCTTIEDISTQGLLFDVVCSLEVIEHVDKPLFFLKQCTNCLKDNGSLFLSTINRSYQSFAVAILGAEYITRMIPPGTHDWRKFITPDELSLLVEASNRNISVKKINGVIPNISIHSRSLTWQLSEDDTSVNYILHAVKSINDQKMN